MRDHTRGIMSKLENLRVMELLSSKICHDLISPVNAINNGLEFLDPAEIDLFQTSLKLVQSSAQQAVEKLSLFRLMLGTGSDSDYFAEDQIYAALQSHLGDRRITLEIAKARPKYGMELPRHSAKAVMFAALVMADCLPRGGMIQLSNSNWITLEGMRILAQGEPCRLRQDVKSGLNIQIDQADLTVRNVIAYMAALFFDHLDKTLQLTQIAETEIALSAI